MVHAMEEMLKEKEEGEDEEEGDHNDEQLTVEEEIKIKLSKGSLPRQEKEDGGSRGQRCLSGESGRGHCKESGLQGQVHVETQEILWRERGRPPGGEVCQDPGRIS